MSRPNKYSLEDIEQMRSEVTYNPVTGGFTHAANKYTGHYGQILMSMAGYPAGGLSATGYVMVRVLKKKVLANRVAYMLTFGPIPDGMVIDHINGNKADNRIDNLRAVPTYVNAQNRKSAAVTSKTGILGVWRVPWGNTGKVKFVSKIREHGKHRQTILGYFDSQEDAHQAYLEAKRELHEGNTL